MTMKKLLLLCTILAAASCSPKIFSIVQIADAQLGFDAAVKGQEPGATYVNDLTYEKECFERAAESIRGLKPDMIVFTGDQIHRPLDQEQWDKFNELLTLLPSDAKVMHLPGNHDVLISEGKVDNTPFTSRYGSDRFVYNVGKFCVIGINSNLIKYDDTGEEEQFQWLKTTLEQSGESAVKVIFCHHPFFLTDIDEEDSYFPIQKAKRKRYFDLFADYGVSAVFAGHRHDNSEGEYKGIKMQTATSVAYQIGEAKPSFRFIMLSTRRDHAPVQDMMVVVTAQDSL